MLFILLSVSLYIKGDLTLKTKNEVAATTGTVTAIDKATANDIDVDGDGNSRRFREKYN